MKRYRTIDTIRGASMCWMMVAHLSGWWITSNDFWIAELIWALFDFMGSTTFMFISGMSMTMFFRGRLLKAQLRDDYTEKIAKREYIFRSILLLMVAFGYNLFVALAINKIYDVWKWFVLQAIGISLLMAYPFLKLSKFVRICTAIIFWMLYLIILIHVYPYKGEFNFYGIIFFIFYNSLDLDPILGFFPFLLLGTVIGDIIFEINLIENDNVRHSVILKKFIIPTIIIGIGLVLFGIFFELNLNIYYGHGVKEPFPDFLIRGSFPWMIYSLGIILIIFSILLYIEEAQLFRKNDGFRFFFYYSYYSLTIYLVHNLLYFAFYKQLNGTIIWFYIITTTILVGIILKIMHDKLGPKVSLKNQLGRLSFKIAEIIVVRKNNKGI
ncbi:MAG: heparan-alpha-glucosaminide N-acetyltransferase domain-containing protein [Promethearchaeia archaeon]